MDLDELRKYSVYVPVLDENLALFDLTLTVAVGYVLSDYFEINKAVGVPAVVAFGIAFHKYKQIPLSIKKEE